MYVNDVMDSLLMVGYEDAGDICMVSTESTAI